MRELCKELDFQLPRRRALCRAGASQLAEARELFTLWQQLHRLLRGLECFQRHRQRELEVSVNPLNPLTAIPLYRKKRNTPNGPIGQWANAGGSIMFASETQRRGATDLSGDRLGHRRRLAHHRPGGVGPPEARQGVALTDKQSGPPSATGADIATRSRSVRHCSSITSTGSWPTPSLRPSAATVHPSRRAW